MRPLVATITTEDLIGCSTHWFGGRTVPCEGHDCKACLQGTPWRWHSYVGALWHATDQHVIFESTAAASQPFLAYRKTYGTLRGCKFEAKRAAGKANGRVVIRTRQDDLQKVLLPPEPDIIQALSILWNLATRELTSSGYLREMPHLRVKRGEEPQMIDPTASGNGEHEQTA